MKLAGLMEPGHYDTGKGSVAREKALNDCGLFPMYPTGEHLAGTLYH